MFKVHSNRFLIKDNTLRLKDIKLLAEKKAHQTIKKKLQKTFLNEKANQLFYFAAVNIYGDLNIIFKNFK